MKLLRFRVTNFRSIEDSGWVDCNDVTTLVGVNESGKSNLLLALWKLNPAREGNIDVLHDLPVSKQSSLRNSTENVKFIEAEFLLDEESEEIISKKPIVLLKKKPLLRFQDILMVIAHLDLTIIHCKIKSVYLMTITKKQKLFPKKNSEKY